MMTKVREVGKVLTSGHFLSLLCWRGHRDPSSGCRGLPSGRQSLTSSHCWRPEVPGEWQYILICPTLTAPNSVNTSHIKNLKPTWRVSRSLVLKLLPASNVAARLASMVSVLWLKMFIIIYLFIFWIYHLFNHHLVNLQQCLLSVFIIGNTHYTEISGLVQMRAPAHFYQLGTFSTLIVITSQVQIWDWTARSWFRDRW